MSTNWTKTLLLITFSFLLISTNAQITGKVTAENKKSPIPFDNAIDNLLYADGKNCAILKETVMDFIAEHANEAAERLSFDDVPGSAMKDLLVAIGRGKGGRIG